MISLNDKMITRQFQIMQMTLKIHMPEDVPIPENFQKFEVKKEEILTEVDIEYFFQYTDKMQKTVEETLANRKKEFSFSRENIEVFYTDKGECRFTKLWNAPLPYGVVQQEEGGKCRIWYDYSAKDMLHIDTVFCSLFCLEKYALLKESLILHSAFMCYKDTAVLFSAPSGTGKSTQADLWEKYRGTRTINGDRSLLTRLGNGWFASGWPVCGSSEICFNEKFPVRAIVMLRQAKENRVSRLKGLSAFREVVAQITINSWDREFQIRAMDMIEQMLAEIPVYMLECDISERAVECLEEMIGK